MRWKDKTEPTPKNGEVRFEARFAWRPVKIGGWWVWLERYWVSAYWYQSVAGNGWWAESRFHLWEHKAR